MKINKLLPIIIMLLLSMTLASCAGIGDGALIGGEAALTGGDGATDGGYLVAVWQLIFLDNKSMPYYVRKEEAEELFELLFFGKYDKAPDRVDVEALSYYELKFIRVDSKGFAFAASTMGDMYGGVYHIYPDGYVIQETSKGTRQEGYIDGVYEKLNANVLKTNPPEISKSAEEEAGFSFDSLIIATEPGKTYTVSDFPEIDCISVKYLMGTGDNNKWILTLDSDTEQEVRESFKKLEARDDIKHVDFDYLVTISW